MVQMNSYTFNGRSFLLSVPHQATHPSSPAISSIPAHPLSPQPIPSPSPPPPYPPPSSPPHPQPIPLSPHSGIDRGWAGGEKGNGLGRRGGGLGERERGGGVSWLASSHNRSYQRFAGQTASVLQLHLALPLPLLSMIHVDMKYQSCFSYCGQRKVASVTDSLIECPLTPPTMGGGTHPQLLCWGFLQTSLSQIQ